MRRTHEISKFIDSVKELIERCIKKYMSLKQTMTYLLENHEIQHSITRAIWEQLKKENPEFFKEYYGRLELLRQIVEFKELCRRQIDMMKMIENLNVLQLQHQHQHEECFASNTQNSISYDEPCLAYPSSFVDAPPQSHPSPVFDQYVARDLKQQQQELDIQRQQQELYIQRQQQELDIQRQQQELHIQRQQQELYIQRQHQQQHDECFASNTQNSISYESCLVNLSSIVDDAPPQGSSAFGCGYDDIGLEDQFARDLEQQPELDIQRQHQEQQPQHQHEECFASNTQNSIFVDDAPPQEDTSSAFGFRYEDPNFLSDLQQQQQELYIQGHQQSAFW